MAAKLSAIALTLIRGERCLFQNVGFALNPGELLLLRGANGSGKTSLLRVLAGLATPESGDVFWNDVAIGDQRQDYHASIVWLAHQTGLKADLTLVENLRFEMSLRPQSDRDLDEVLQRLGIVRLKQLPLRLLSAGQQRRVALARMLLANVPLWFMDEPFTNLDDDGRRLVLQLTESHLKEGGMCVLAAHQAFAIDAPTTTMTL